MSEIAAQADLAIEIRGLEKRYVLFESPMQELLDVAGLRRLVPWRRDLPSHPALTGIDLVVRAGERIGVVGRNGAGKTTLLRTINSTLRPTSGTCRIKGRVHSLADLGTGFHPEFSGRDNVSAALRYNGLTATQFDQAFADVVDFCELGQAIDAPLKSYSAGMLARLYFATATAIRPEILVVDEVLGAGDAYFSARASARMRQLGQSGCTLLLVSHSMQQVLEYCQRAIWIEGGRIVLDASPIVVIKAYEAFLQRLALRRAAARNPNEAVIQDRSLVETVLQEVLRAPRAEDGDSTAVAEGGVSQWPGSGRLTFGRVDIAGDDRQSANACSFGGTLDISVGVRLGEAGEFLARVAVVVFGADGRWMTRFISPPVRVTGARDEERTVVLRVPQIRWAPGQYVLSFSLHESKDPWNVQTAERYDLLSRSYRLEVRGRASRAAVFHGGRWDIHTTAGPESKLEAAQEPI